MIIVDNAYHPQKTENFSTVTANNNNIFDTAMINTAIQSICTTIPYPSSNKPQDQRYEKLDNTFQLESCVKEGKENLNKVCLNDRKKYSKWKVNQQGYHDVISKYEQVALIELAQLEKKFDAHLFQAYLKKGLEVPNDVMNQFYEIVLVSVQAKHAFENKVGNCGELASHAIYKMLVKNLDVKIQKVEVRTGKLNHFFVLIDSNLDDVSSDDLAKTKSILSSLSAGHFCDIWNKGYYKPVRENQFLLYTGDWESLSVTTVSNKFDFSNVQPETINLIKTFLTEINIPVVEIEKRNFKLEL